MSSIKTYSPLRYPGGKSSLSKFLKEITTINSLTGGTYVELYAGGAGAALNLLFSDFFSRIHINDYDFRIFSMWNAILNHTEDFLKLVVDTPITIDEWWNQKALYENANQTPGLLLGFSTFYLNRTNRSGIIYKAGPIGGFDQKGNYLIDVRFNKKDLIKRIEKIASYREKILLTNSDALNIISEFPNLYPEAEKVFLYLDPPYYKKGQQLYLNNYSHLDHLALANSISRLNPDYKWLISYDNVTEIRNMYPGLRQSCFNLSYTLQEKKQGSELLIFSPNLVLSESITVNNRTSPLELILNNE
ncbi:DNA adenine methylase [Algoriphagus persicinus]|uniref:DNA adenine methylase n=1 Tax=Algoriphagus persicinus TaxID=3108754 RepID=UPI002B3F2013|nr:DNA adenine methylase [Algoriphagus sp. E1-3-M2]MEB2787349.1 DNA adenine methylase [Algoriphagus sp. E1-3-M2]